MANKETKRERRESAKKQRLDAQRRAARRRRLVKVRGLSMLVIAIVAITALVIWKKNSDAAHERKVNLALNTAATAAGCDQVKGFGEQGHEHIAAPATFSYDSNPPTSGSHYNGGDGNGPANTGVHTAPIQDEIQTHNLEHGHFGIQYSPGKLKPDLLAALVDFTNKNNAWVFLAPRTAPGFSATLAFTHWTQLLNCGEGLKDDPKLVTSLAQAFYDRFPKSTQYEAAPGTPL